MERQRQELDQWKTGIIFDKIKNNERGKLLILKTENFFDIICDSFDCPPFYFVLVAKGFIEFQKRNPVFTI